jgi:hypothetical protein
MAGRLVVTTLNDDTGVLATQNGMTGIAKAWVNFNGQGTVAIRNSFNVSSITDNGTGDYTFNLTNAMPNANYVVVGSAGGGTTSPNSYFTGPSTSTTMSTTQFRFNIRNDTANLFDAETIMLSVFSS